ncbi:MULTISPECIES: AAA family ATPase [Niastella]|uniref:AAA family ATPase n=1 Tax=Niastella soli TaxID=2821487 RepID=A0ABS3Z405_9BACT|nr:AAA family ATPase [Niastella soli]MBO9204899.1 AAA family ATPase [Niastella soli]
MWTITTDKDWDWLRRHYEWVRDMEEVPQDPVHHAEGNVAIHTRMVLTALQQLGGYKQLPAQDQEMLWAAALLHDVEKRSTTVHETDGSISSKGHSKKGTQTARQILYTQIPTPFLMREQMVQLVRYHGMPIWAIERRDLARVIIETSVMVDTSMLALLARADALGRVCNDQTDLLYRIDLFEALCQEYDCWGQPKAFQTPHARFHYFNKTDSDPGFVPFDNFSATVVMLSGLPGAGKDRYVQQHYKDWPVINLDDIRRKNKIAPTDKSGNGTVVQLAKEQAREYLRKKQHFVWNATNITRQMRAQLVELFVAYKAYVKLVYVEVPYATLHRQNKDREAMVPGKAVDKLVSKLEVPAPWEAHEVIYYIKE